MEYLLKVSALISIFYFIYKVFLQHETFFESIRIFLFLGLISSFIIPFLVIPIYIEYTSALTSSYDGVTTVQKIEEPLSILDYLTMVYLAGVLFFFIRFMIQLVSLVAIIFKGKSKKQGGYTFVRINTNMSPFSFFNWIVYNPNSFNKTELDQIITHEKAHAQQYHSMDILLTQLSCIVLWFNPFMWLYNKDLKQNLEFLADNLTINNIKNKKGYQYTLLKTAFSINKLALSNNFYTSSIKKRIVMLHKSKSKKINQFKFVIAIPLLSIFLMSFNTEKVCVAKTPNSIKPIETGKNHGVLPFSDQQIDPLYILDGKEISKKKFDALNTDDIESVSELKDKSEIKKYGKKGKHGVIIITSKKNGNNGKSVNDNIDFGYGLPLYILDGKEIQKKQLVELKSNNIKSVVILKNKPEIKKYGKKGKHGVVIITSKK
ncbi:M56 family metallopeptidase [Flavivirga aquimarina]|uniref:M56 family metallopeptidase n=1 Tax=Flavivirga aquimarina TaxID=2027862 RepID=A0ABT8WE90_9FLAO|nr:M56 family metallopeptidase [Flavivirga aquimarina]MDO5971363.1 M56 family metallopeptidase [Flavivirga aquimarina]